MNADLETQSVEYGEYGEVDAFESTGDRFTTASLRVCVLMVAEES